MNLTRFRTAMLVLLAAVLFLQSPLELLWSGFAFLDEICGLLGLAALLAGLAARGDLRFRRDTALIFLALICFCAAGLLGNLLYRYQGIFAAATDLYTHLKFFLILALGAILCGRNPKAFPSLARWARITAGISFAFFLLDVTTNCFPTREARFGLRPVQLLFRHPTYLAGAMVFLLAVLTLCYERKNRPFLLCALVILLATLRSKALAAGMLYGFLWAVVISREKPLKFHHLLLLIPGVAMVAGPQLHYYYIELRGQSARSVLTQTAIQIAADYFPLGTGFAAFASSEAAKHYSPVYQLYGFTRIPELDGRGADFFSDTFWPIILGQTGILGTLCYLSALGLVFRRTVSRLKALSFRSYAAGMFTVSYLLISSTSEPAFNNAIAAPLALVLGCLYALEKENGL